MGVLFAVFEVGDGVSAQTGQFRKLADAQSTALSRLAKTTEFQGIPPHRGVRRVLATLPAHGVDGDAHGTSAFGLTSARVPQGQHLSQVGRQTTEPGPATPDAAVDIFYQTDGRT